MFILLLCFCCSCTETKDFKEGDIIFQISKSKQSPLVQYATGSIWSHCGIIVEKNKKFYVLEASNIVKLTPIDTWISRGKGSIYRTKRIYNKDIKISYSKYLGIPYDLSFKFNNGKYYCSELVYEIYKNQFGVEIAKPHKLSHYNTLGIKDKMKARGMSLNQYAIAPCDLL